MMNHINGKFNDNPQNGAAQPNRHESYARGWYRRPVPVPKHSNSLGTRHKPYEADSEAKKRIDAALGLLMLRKL